MLARGKRASPSRFAPVSREPSGLLIVSGQATFPVPFPIANGQGGTDPLRQPAAAPRGSPGGRSRQPQTRHHSGSWLPSFLSVVVDCRVVKLVPRPTQAVRNHAISC